MNDKGRPCWTTFGCLREGILTFRHSNPDCSTVQYENGETQVLTSSFIFFTRDGAKRQCEENSEYWQRKAHEL